MEVQNALNSRDETIAIKDVIIKHARTVIPLNEYVLMEAEK
ncbi:MAG TPA: hypothetical protein VJL89_01090 [Thermodesulfovibrionia bacterium]|nr:hypothetical protein [Thermodesulfovibrionia bacterium]